MIFAAFYIDQNIPKDKLNLRFGQNNIVKPAI